MAETTLRPHRVDVIVATCTWVVPVVILVALPVLTDVEPEVADDLPRLGAAAWWFGLAVLTTQSLLLVWRRRAPGLVTLVVATGVPVGALAGLDAAVGLTSVALLVAVYTLGTMRSPAWVSPLLGVTALLTAAGHLAAAVRQGVSSAEAVLTGVLQAVVLVGIPLLVATVVVTRRESSAARDDRLRALEREQDALVEAAVARERTAMARELHDIAAHHLTGIAVMSAAIATQIDTDPAAAKVSVGEVRRESTAVLRDLRSLVGLLRDHDGTPAGSGVRTETLAGIDGLVEAVVAGGQDVVLRVVVPDDGRALGTGIGPLAQLAAYRTVQESLANAGRHAVGAHCEVVVDDSDVDSLVVTVRNTPAPGAPRRGRAGGLGLVGMRERAELTGSRLEAGAEADGAWLVRLRTPRSEALDSEPFTVAVVT